MGCVYIPPENSLYSSIDAFLDIESELVNFIVKDMKCALVGDFNAKTAVLEDFSEPDETFLNVMDVSVEDDLFRYCYDYQVLLDNNISLKRYTQCECRPNNFGRKLLEMCKSALAIFEKYCHHWKLKVNLQKTKVIIFCKRK